MPVTSLHHPLPSHPAITDISPVLSAKGIRLTYGQIVLKRLITSARHPLPDYWAHEAGVEVYRLRTLNSLNHIDLKALRGELSRGPAVWRRCAKHRPQHIGQGLA